MVEAVTGHPEPNPDGLSVLKTPGSFGSSSSFLLTITN